MKTPEELLREFAEKYFDVNNGEKHCFAPEDCYWRISDTNICTSPDKCDWNKDKIDLFLSDLNALLDKLMPTEEEAKKEAEELFEGTERSFTKGMYSGFLFCYEWFRSRMKG